MNATTTAPATGKTDEKGKTDAAPKGNTAPAANKTKDNETGDDATASTGGGKDIVPSKYRDQYAANKGTCGDFIASELSAVMEGGIDMLKGVKKANGIAESAWAGLNNGQQRMNVSNALRAAYLRGEEIDILGKKFSFKTHMEEYGDTKFDGSNEASVRKFLAFISMPENTRNMRAIKKFFHDDPQKARERAEREDKAAKAKAEKEEAKKKAAEDKAAAEAAKKAEGDKGKADSK